YFLFRDVDAKVEEVVVMPPDPFFVVMEPLTMHVIRQGGVKKYVSLNITLELRDVESQALAENNKPKLRDVFIDALSQYYANLPSLDDGVRVKAIKSRLIEASASAIGKDRVVDVLIQSVFEQGGAK
ncbi:MAG: flagellar basal body-associated FliL family protein, partial [Proteobacteria bacterium]|nr:flagellar basal body-associated FliL family protein [Pseudomonadota bacterium]